VQVAVVPLSKKPELIEVALPIVQSLRGQFRVEYDQTGGNIGRRYRRQDEIGTPFCITVDFDTLNDKAVTIRHRDSTEQERVGVSALSERLGALTG
jgi:glycyl-tRNA synthetase